MKRVAILLVFAFVSVFSLIAEEAIVIDFNKLVADFPADKPVQNQATITDFSSAAGSSFSQAEKDQMKTSLAIANWEVILNTSATSVLSARFSHARAAKVGANAAQYANESILGIRVYFPTEPVNAFATVLPPFEIPAYVDKTTVGADGKLVPVEAEARKGSKFDGFGVTKNVGIIKSVTVNVFGNNAPNGISVIFKDSSNRDQEYFLGYLNFDGWRRITWENPNYITDVRNRELRTFPLYPQSTPTVKLIGFRIYKDSSQAGGDFVGYIKDVSLVFDKAVLNLARDIDDEGTWGIMADREDSRRNAELKRLGQRQVLRYLESRKMDNPAERQTAPARTN